MKRVLINKLHASIEDTFRYIVFFVDIKPFVYRCDYEINRFTDVYFCVNNDFEAGNHQPTLKLPHILWNHIFSLHYSPFFYIGSIFDIWHTPAQRCWRNDVHANKFKFFRCHFELFTFQLFFFIIYVRNLIYFCHEVRVAILCRK